jgi:hypothetical protein
MLIVIIIIIIIIIIIKVEDNEAIGSEGWVRRDLCSERRLYYNADVERPSYEREKEVNRESTSSWRLETCKTIRIFLVNTIL